MSSKQRMEKKIKEVTQNLVKEDRQKMINLAKTVFLTKRSILQIAQQQNIVFQRELQISTGDVVEKDEFGNPKSQQRLKIDIEYNKSLIEEEQFNILQWYKDIDMFVGTDSESAKDIKESLESFKQELVQKKLLVNVTTNQ